jgi:hypothetical protein
MTFGVIDGWNAQAFAKSKDWMRRICFIIFSKKWFRFYSYVIGMLGV